MFAIDRRGVLALTAVLPFAGAAKALAQGAAAAASPAAWDLTDLYPDWNAWDAARKGVLAALPRLSAYKGHLGDSAEAMVKALSDISDVQKTDARVYVYAELSVIDVAQGTVTGSAPIRFAESMTTNSVDGAGDAWDLLTTKQKIETLQAKIEANRELLKLGLGTLSQDPPGTLKREKWETIDGTSFMQDVAVELRLGATPVQH